MAFFPPSGYAIKKHAQYMNNHEHLAVNKTFSIDFTKAR